MNKLIQKNYCYCLGYVGLTLSITLAETGHRVIGFEKDQHIVDLTNQGLSHFKEQGIAINLARQIDQKLLTATSDLALTSEATVFITVGTPLNKFGEINLESVISAAHQVGKIMQENALVIFRSTMKGVTRSIIKPILEEIANANIKWNRKQRTLEGTIILKSLDLKLKLCGILMIR